MMTAAVRAPSGRQIWKAVREELMLNLYPLPFSTLAPTVYHIYLHPDDFEAIEPVASRIVAQIESALTAEVERFNGRLERTAGRVLTRLLDREELPPIESPAAGWEVHLQPDRNGELERGHLGIVSALAMPAPPEYAGTPTTRIVKSVIASGARRATSTTDVPQNPVDAPQLSAPQDSVPSSAVTPATHDSSERARLTYEDDQGPHVFVMRKDVLSVGRGGSSAWVDVQVVSSSKVSREHFRLRRDATGRFFIQDVSLWGTSVDDVPIPPAVKTAEAVAQPGPEQPLPAKARIGLADALVIHFDSTSRS
jgi:hypothetical protein